MTGTELYVDNLSVSLTGSHGKVVALTDVSFKVLPGEVVGLVGESGAGKSMIARAIANQLPNNADISGRIFMDGIDLLTSRAEHMDLHNKVNAALCFQNPRLALSPTRTIGKQIADRLSKHKNLSNKKMYDDVYELLRSVGIRDPERMYKSFPHELSGGMCQRAMIALALACHSSVLLADEPTTGLDVTLTREILDLFRQMADRDHRQVLLISHDIAAIASICDRLLVLYAGVLIEAGSTLDVVQNPMHPYTRSLIDAVPQLNRKITHSTPLAGIMPQLAARPESCPFLSRCKFSDHECEVEIPPIVIRDQKREVRCFHLPQFGGSEDHIHEYQHTEQSVDSAINRNDCSDPIIRLENVRVGYQSRTHSFSQTVLRDINLTFNRGEVVGIVGESGCGKSTLARTIMGLISPLEGEVWFRGFNLKNKNRTQLRHLRQHMQLVFQDALDSLNPRLRVDEIITDPLRLKKLSREDKTISVENIMNKVRLDQDFKKRFPRELSGGQAQRVGIARGLVVDPELIIFDEPTSALDATIQAQVLLLIRSLIERKDRTYIFITHDLATVLGLCDRVIVMYLGRVVEDGPVNRVFREPTHPYTQALLAAIPRLFGRSADDAVKLKRDFEENLQGAGCSLLPRCPVSTSVCSQNPELVEVSEGHKVACWQVKK